MIMRFYLRLKVALALSNSAKAIQELYNAMFVLSLAFTH
jgi:hypothetical protein